MTCQANSDNTEILDALQVEPLEDLEDLGVDTAGEVMGGSWTSGRTSAAMPS